MKRKVTINGRQFQLETTYDRGQTISERGRECGIPLAVNYNNYDWNFRPTMHIELTHECDLDGCVLYVEQYCVEMVRLLNLNKNSSTRFRNDHSGCMHTDDFDGVDKVASMGISIEDRSRETRQDFDNVLRGILKREGQI